MLLPRQRDIVVYFLPGAFINDVHSVDLPAGIPWTAAELARQAPPDCYGFYVARLTTHRYYTNHRCVEQIEQQIIKTYYINADLLDIDDVRQLYGKTSKLYRLMLRRNYRHVVRLSSGDTILYHPDNIELLTSS